MDFTDSRIHYFPSICFSLRFAPNYLSPLYFFYHSSGRVRPGRYRGQTTVLQKQSGAVGAFAPNRKGMRNTASACPVNASKTA